MFINKFATGMVCAGVAGLAACGAGLVVDMLESRERNKELDDIKKRAKTAKTREEQIQISSDILQWADRWCRV